LQFPQGIQGRPDTVQVFDQDQLMAELRLIEVVKGVLRQSGDLDGSSSRDQLADLLLQVALARAAAAEADGMQGPARQPGSEDQP
jgi:hypothetical protein